MNTGMQLVLTLFLLSCAGEGPVETSPRSLNLQAIPANAAIVFHKGGDLFVMSADGAEVQQITHGLGRNLEHVAVSFDRRYIVANEQLPNPRNEPGGHSRLWLYDMLNQVEIPLRHDFASAGNGGVDWSPDGFIYFAAKEANPYPRPVTPEQHRANAGANDIYRVRPGGAPERVLATADRGEADVSVSEDGSMLAFVSQSLDAEHNEIWVAGSNGLAPRLAYRAGMSGVASAHDPEFSPDNTALVFSVVNSDVAPNFPDRPGANTAHDIYRMEIASGRLLRLTAPGAISIVPDWMGESVLYQEINDHVSFAGHRFYIGASLIGDEAESQRPLRLQLGAGSPRWIPRANEAEPADLERPRQP